MYALWWMKSGYRIESKIEYVATFILNFPKIRHDNIVFKYVGVCNLIDLLSR